ncbi:hypothetical protein DOK78_002610 [Enterococcus sp. DIV2402]|uniref:Uncharacterized protein n=1 Tax=Candidatus Enterococcus lowellii TaxID=2230877 RepID=A0ABZ2SQA9_9ENTE|nr:hypothetical protein [Enterococcus sp. DIV2402]MBO0463276.1 hypothetical protein [Enterococcus sp. DIV2402]
MTVNQRRTKKEFHEYNEYHDRPFGLKWGTAFAMEELVTGIQANEEWALKENQLLEQLLRETIDVRLFESLLYSKEVEIQLNNRDPFGRLVDSVSGFFLGEAYDEYFILEDQKIFWEDVRHIKVKNQEKWFTIDLFEKDSLRKETSSVSNEELTYVVNEDYQSFFDEIY